MKKDQNQAEYTYNIRSLEALPAVTKKILQHSQHKIWLFYGTLGAGKTTLIKNLCNELGVKDQISSPTYALINEYHSETNKVYHMDLFRLKSEEEAFDIGIEEYLYENNYCFIEWPQVIEDIIDTAFHELHIAEQEDGSRTIIFK